MSATQDYMDTYDDDPEDSAVHKDLRARLRAAEKALKEKEGKLAEVEAAEQTRRADAAEKIVNDLGFPGLKDDVLAWVQGPLTEGSVREALKARALISQEASDEGDSEGREAKDQSGRSSTVSASDVGRRLADAASGADQRDLEQKINEAESQEELRALIAEAGLERTHS